MSLPKDGETNIHNSEADDQYLDVPEFLRRPQDRELSFVGQQFKEKAELYEQRNAIYKDNYKRHGHCMLALFPHGLTLRTAKDFNRFNIFNQMMGKLTRYATNFEAGGHNDSLDDLSVYSMMQKELDNVES